MTTFDKREEAFEKKFAIDEELKFKAVARRNRLLGLWAAEKIGLAGAEADSYARQVVAAEFDEGGNAAVLAKILGDFGAKGVNVNEEEIRAHMDQLMAQAVAQVKAGI
jgi:hypothetical protein